MGAAALDALCAPVEALAEGDEAWLVGGALRDVLLGRAVEDVDLAVAGDAGAAAARLARAHGAGRFRLSEEFDSWRVHGGSLALTVDLMPLQGPDIAADLHNRDFTVNALALPVGRGSLIDPTGGRADLESGVLRMVGPTAFTSDPLRVMRLARLAHQLGFQPDAETVAQARADAAQLDRVAGERVRDELIRLLTEGSARAGVDVLDRVGALAVVIPELEDAKGVEQNPYHHADVFGHTMEVLQRVEEIGGDPEPVFRSSAGRVAERLAEPLADGMTRGQVLLLAALMHDMAKPETRAVTDQGRVTFFGHDRRGAEMAEEWCERHRTSRALRLFLAACVRHHLAPGFLVHRQPMSLRHIDRYLRRVDPIPVELAVLSAADRLATNGPRTRQSAIDRHIAVLRDLTRTHFELLNVGPVELPVDGADLARELGRTPGPWLKDLLDLLREEVLLKRVDTPERAIKFAQKHLAGIIEDPSLGGTLNERQ